MPNARSYASGPILRWAAGGGCALLLVLSLGAHALAQSEQPHELVNVLISRVLARLDRHITDDAAVHQHVECDTKIPG